ncbi:hypothetical protein G6F64_014290 [Rhizopus arrhizus]|uniref:ABC transporter domain-containing protein n=1 Tax=Rhizopus oryzae TaxID=64495 RepID=A0A9P6WTU3_RHIOR|nr:hypothetical protein G6F64_014290 [Rhizopus arrhizus]
MTVEQNIAFGRKQDGLGKDAISKRVGEMLELVQMGHLGKRKPHQLSGGQQQRVALARSLAKGPKLLLLDEPAAGLRNRENETLDRLLTELCERDGITVLLVEHVMQLVM